MFGPLVSSYRMVHYINNTQSTARGYGLTLKEEISRKKYKGRGRYLRPRLKMTYLFTCLIVK